VNNTNENKVKQKIKEYLETLRPKMFYFSVPASPLGQAGITDILCSFNGEFVAIEVKSEEAYKLLGHNLSVSQMMFRNLVWESGGVWMCVCSVDTLRDELFRAFPDEFRGKITNRKYRPSLPA
jgi:hypothetical protein